MTIVEWCSATSTGGMDRSSGTPAAGLVVSPARKEDPDRVADDPRTGLGVVGVDVGKDCPHRAQ